jgi:hypothetical protein
MSNDAAMVHEPQIGAIFDSRATAEVAVEDLRHSGLADEQLGVAVHEPGTYIFEEDVETEIAPDDVKQILRRHGGQVVAKPARSVRRARLLDHRGIDIPIEVDGGLNPTTIARARSAGADFFVSGSWIRTHPQGKHTATQELRGVVTTVPEGP